MLGLLNNLQLYYNEVSYLRGGHDRGILKLEWSRPWYVKLWCQFSKSVIGDNFRAVIIVNHRVLHEAKSIHITDIRSTIGTKKVEPAYHLLKHINLTKSF